MIDIKAKVYSLYQTINSKFVMRVILGLFIAFIILRVIASVSDPCLNEANSHVKNMCYAILRLDVRRCELLPFETKQLCISRIVKIQREQTWSVTPKKKDPE
jgi:hypothetical protein